MAFCYERPRQRDCTPEWRRSCKRRPKVGRVGRPFNPRQQQLGMPLRGEWRDHLNLSV